MQVNNKPWSAWPSSPTSSPTCPSPSWPLAPFSPSSQASLSNRTRPHQLWRSDMIPTPKGQTTHSFCLEWASDDHSNWFRWLTFVPNIIHRPFLSPMSIRHSSYCFKFMMMSRMLWYDITRLGKCGSCPTFYSTSHLVHNSVYSN